MKVGMSPPSPVRAEDRTKEGKWTVIRTGQKNRDDELTRTGNYARQTTVTNLSQKGSDGPPEEWITTTHVK